MGAPTVLLVHGWGGDRQSWAPILSDLAGSHRVLSVDVRGHGQSTGFSGGFDPHTIADDLAAVLGTVGAGPVVAVGHSWGGQLVTALAVEHPQHVRSLVVVDPAYGATSEPDLRAQLARWNGPGAREELLRFAEGAWSSGTPAAVRQQVVRGFRTTSTKVMAEAFDAMYLADDAFGLRGRTEAYLRRVRCRTLGLFSTETAGAWARGLPGFEVAVWPGTGHYLHLERPAAFVAMLQRWCGPQASTV